MTDRLSLYNQALLLCGEGGLASLTENREPRRLLDTAWDGGAVRFCLAKGMWIWATRTVQLDYDPSIEPDFGYKYAFDKPDDYIRTAGVGIDQYLDSPLTRYSDEVGYIWCDLQTIYMQYISDDTGYGFNYAGWSDSFTNYVVAYLASLIVYRLTQSENKIVMVKKELKESYKDAITENGMNMPPRFIPQGRWASARKGRMGRGWTAGSIDSFSG